MATSNSGSRKATGSTEPDARPLGATAQDGPNTDETTSVGTPEGAQDAPLAHLAEGGAEAAVLAAPEPPTNTGKAAKHVRLMPPTSRFVVEGFPVLDWEGVELSATQTDELVKHAKANGVRLMVDGEVVK